MINSRELYPIIISTLAISISILLFKNIYAFPTIILSVFLVILVSIIAKKITAFYLDSQIEMKLWTIERYGFSPAQHFKKPFPSGIVFPLIFSLITFGKFVWMASLVFDVKPMIYRTAKRHGLYSYSEMTEGHIGFIAAAGIFTNLVFAVIAYLIGFEEISRLSIYFAFFNMIPFSDLDGNKIFFGSMIIWSLLAALVLIGLFYAIFLI
ncbi:MAG: hypothetical protein QXU39_01040 [Candidatus Pacearchaeota archaeon]